MAKINKIIIGYDSDDDILEIVIGPSAKEAISVEQEDEVFLRIDPETKEIVGMTILGFKNYLFEGQKKGKKYHEFIMTSES
ncbi:MAG: hypothetical protein A3G93_09880 [Nitrospinae bacterium RIFCSPLOWO2_12_FULL_45_22]|nr:MAG: hypothetical protein A3G93_09880 [Nitrospinae bacterium RIFCSPLOWO2_12_FULL_45_22]